MTRRQSTPGRGVLLASLDSIDSICERMSGYDSDRFILVVGLLWAVLDKIADLNVPLNLSISIWCEASEDGL